MCHRDMLQYHSDQQMVESTVHYTWKLNTVEHLFEANERVAHAIVENGKRFYNVSQAELDGFIQENEREGGTTDRTSVSQAMKHFVRDWSNEGYDERQEAFPCVINALASMSRSEEQPLQVLVPGAGIGRLAHEIAVLGGTFTYISTFSNTMS